MLDRGKDRVRGAVLPLPSVEFRDGTLGEAHMADDAGLPATPRFAVVLRGYDRRQVDEHVERLQRVFARMRADLDAARSQSPAPPGPVPRPTPRPRPGLPEGDQIGGFTDRMESILAEAEAEAAEIRRNAQRAARAETDGVRAQLADLVRQRDNVLAELMRMRGQLEGMLAAPTAAMPARYGPDRWSGPPPGAEPGRPAGAPLHGPGVPAPAPPSGDRGPLGPVPPPPVRPGAGPTGPAQRRPDPAGPPPAGPREPVPSTTDDGRGPAARGAGEDRPAPSSAHVDPDALDTRRTNGRGDGDGPGRGAGRPTSGAEPGGANGSAPGLALPSPPTSGSSASGGPRTAPGTRNGAGPASAGPGGEDPSAGRKDASGAPPAGSDPAEAAAHREPGRPAHRLPTGAYPAVTGDPAERTAAAAPEPSDLFRTPGREAPPAGARPPEAPPAPPRAVSERPVSERPASERPVSERGAPERPGSGGAVRPADPTVLAPVPGRPAAGTDGP